MFNTLIEKIFGSHSQRLVKKLQPKVAEINALEADISALSDVELLGRSQALMARARGPASSESAKKSTEADLPADPEFRHDEDDDDGEDLAVLLPEAFALVREAAKRTIGLRPFDVQLLGAMILHDSAIAEMKTGEGKTLVAALAAYLNALSGCGVHVVTVNDYLALRDAEWMGKVYSFLGMSIGVIQSGMDDDARRAAYACDITYGTNNELAFDYLRDNLKLHKDHLVQRGFHFAIVDEVDSILIDEARTPLIISGQSDSDPDLYYKADILARQMNAEHFEVDEKQRGLTLTEEGNTRLEELLKQNGAITEGTLYDLHNVKIVHHVHQALKAHNLFTRDVEYIVQDDQVKLIDEFTGRIMEGRRYSDGLHQALEAKEKLQVQNENQTLATVTFQNFFRLYEKLAGMTGTAMTEATEFEQIYNLPVYDLPTNIPMQRIDHQDEIYASSEERDEAVIAQIRQCHDKGQPVLVGTISIERSEIFSRKLKQAGLKHQVLNARQNASEAAIIADAGTPGAITIATNMAGRGTDIQLGGNVSLRLAALAQEKITAEKYEAKSCEITEAITQARSQILEAGGLYVIGTERHESRRIDNQLRGRSGRQGDAGESKFFVSLSDDLMRIFGSERLEGMLKKLGLERGEAIVHPWVSKAIERAQKKVEERNFEIRKQLLKFDDVMNEQRTVVFEYRRELMDASDVSEQVAEYRHEMIAQIIEDTMPAQALPDEWDMSALQVRALRVLGIEIDAEAWKKEEGLGSDQAHERLRELSDVHMVKKTLRFSPEVMRAAERSIMLQFLDSGWKEHLLQLDRLRQGIGLRAVGQRDPLSEYKQEAFVLFQDMLSLLKENVTTFLSWVEVATPPSAPKNRTGKETKKSKKSKKSNNKTRSVSSAEQQTISVGKIDVLGKGDNS